MADRIPTIQEFLAKGDYINLMKYYGTTWYEYFHP